MSAYVFDFLLGKTITKIVRNDKTQLQTNDPYRWDVDTNENLVFYTDCGKIYAMYHSQDCCESVYIEDIIGDLDDLLAASITIAEVVSEDATTKDEDGWDYSATWTFYKFATMKGYVTIRWYGSSNGYYSESVDFVEVVVA